MDEILPFPLLALVGQAELKTALILGLVNPGVGGVLLSGPYGVGKTTAVRALLDVMPVIEREEQDEQGRPHPVREPMRLVELPLNARLDDVVGSVNERVLIEQRAVDIIHPDLLTSGGMLETKRIADYAERYGLPTALHFAGSPIAFMANLHCAAAIPSFVALEHHGLDLPFWRGLVTGLPGNYMQDGYVAVPEAPGLGVDLDLEGIAANLRFPGLFEPTDEWNTPKLGFWQPDRRWDK